MKLLSINPSTFYFRFCFYTCICLLSHLTLETSIFLQLYYCTIQWHKFVQHLHSKLYTWEAWVQLQGRRTCTWLTSTHQFALDVQIRHFASSFFILWLGLIRAETGQNLPKLAKTHVKKIKIKINLSWFLI